MADEPGGEARAYGALLEELRRVGRAAVAAQAAAQSCEETVERLAHASTDAPRDDARQLLEALLPVADALGRMADGARRAEPPRGWLARLRGGWDELRALRAAVTILEAQLEGALEGAGVTIERAVGREVDPALHRVVETRPPAPGERDGIVGRVVRPGYLYGGRIVREADVVATREAARGERPAPERPA
ncbi:MAG: nucleotide exchange factor GrpE [Sandaracinaceae bacterium]|nr:nucleotide exchange factor GrpE [Sandaracinaceae bacterium]